MEAKNLLNDPAFNVAYIDLINDRIDEIRTTDPIKEEELKIAVLKLQLLEELMLKLNILYQNPHAYKPEYNEYD